MASVRTISPAEDWYCLCAAHFGKGHKLNGSRITRCPDCHMDAPWVERNMGSGMAVRQVRTPHGNGWFTFTRGAMIGRRTALRILLLGPTRGRIETTQSNNPELWS